MKKSLLQFIISKALFIFITGFVFVGIAVGLSYLLSNKYKSDIYGYSQLFETAHNKANLKTLNDLISEQQFDRLSQEMNLPIEVVKDIRKIEYYDLLSDENTYFKLTLIAQSNSNFNKIAEGLQYYYQNQPLNKNILKAENARIAALVDFKEQEIAKIDSILNQENNLSYESDLFIGKNEIKNELEEEKLKLMQAKGLNFINNSIIPNNAYFPNRSIFGIFGFILGTLLATILFLLSYEMKKSKNA